MQLTVVGGFGLGVSFFVDRAPDAGETVGGARLLQTPGGKGSNQAVGAARLGAQVRLATAIAADAPGRLGRELWAAEGVDASGVAERDGTTMVGAIITDGTGENRIVVADGVLADYAPTDVDACAFAGSAVVLVSTEIATPAAAHALVRGRAAGAITVLNPAPVPDPAAIDWTCVDVLTPNRGEAALLLGGPSDADPSGVAAALHDRFGVAVVMTLGAHGAVVVRADGSTETIGTPSPPSIVDTTGAGDAFNAGLATGLGLGLDLVEAARLGAACGSLAVQVAGVIPALPTRTTVIADLRSRQDVALATALEAQPAREGES